MSKGNMKKNKNMILFFKLFFIYAYDMAFYFDIIEVLQWR